MSIFECVTNRSFSMLKKQIRDEKNIILADFDEISGCSYFENIILAYFDEIGHILKIFCSPEPENKIFGRTGDGGMREFLLVALVNE